MLIILKVGNISNASHLAWVYDIYCRTGIQIPFPIVADRSGEIARKYGMISQDVSNTKTVRNVFIIDDKGVVRTILVYPLNVGRFIPEIIRIVQALQMADCAKTSTPANWVPGYPLITPMPDTFNSLIERTKQNTDLFSWYLGFEEEPEKCINRLENGEKME